VRPELVTVRVPVPEQIIAGRYRLVSRLGSGGMGLVFLAEHLGVGNQVAVKFLDPEPGTDDNRVARFLREAKIGLEVNHPGAAQLLDLGRDEAMRLFLVFEYVEGVDLRELLHTEGRLSFDDARGIALKIAETLAFAHQRFVVHRDVKLENIRVRRDLAGVHVKVLDFGIARLLKDQGVRLTAEGSLAGTPRYMAPEQIRDEPVDGRTDGYALGLVLFEMLSGLAAFNGRNLTQILLKQINEPLPKLREVDPALECAALDAFLARACAKRIDERFDSMADFVRALAALQVSGWPAPRHPSDPVVAATPAVAGGLSKTSVRVDHPTQPEGTDELERPLPHPEVPTEPERAPVARRGPPPTTAPLAGPRPDIMSTVVGMKVPPLRPPSTRWWVGALALSLLATLAVVAWWMRSLLR
jgi:serine/threonine-protein kinase